MMTGCQLPRQIRGPLRRKSSLRKEGQIGNIDQYRPRGRGPDGYLRGTRLATGNFDLAAMVLGTQKWDGHPPTRICEILGASHRTRTP